jgi:signal transduction histidine kinase
MDEAIALTMPLAESKQLTLSFNPVTIPFVVETNHQKLLQILVNLVGNAIKFTDRGQVLLSATNNGKTARFTVADTGCGIALENLERIFDAFWQVDQGLTRRLGGTGLGLKLSREMARSLGGDLEALSTFGQGSTFTVWLPLRHSELV